MMKDLWKLENWIAGLQWFFFIFTNIIVIPITIGEAFQLDQDKLVALIQISFLLTGLACMLQALLGHKRAIMEGQSGLWWGVILSLCYTVPLQGISLPVFGGSLALGIIISGIITLFIGISGLGVYIGNWFKDGVMAV